MMDTEKAHRDFTRLVMESSIPELHKLLAGPIRQSSGQCRACGAPSTGILCLRCRDEAVAMIEAAEGKGAQRNVTKLQQGNRHARRKSAALQRRAAR